MSDPSRSPRPARLMLRFEAACRSDDWRLPEGPVPESRGHDQASELIRDLLEAWVQRERIDAQVNRNLALRFVVDDERIGIDPDVCVLRPTPPEGEELTSLRTWLAGHEPPMLAVEVVSRTHPNKDYSTVPERHAACGTRELWVFDHLMAGPKAFGGPHRIQLWVLDEEEGFVRTYAGDGPVFAPSVGAWLFAVDEGRKLRIASDEAGTDWWMTREERERTDKERERMDKERERMEKEREREEKLAAKAERDEAQSELARLQAELEELKTRLATERRG